MFFLCFLPSSVNKGVSHHSVAAEVTEVVLGCDAAQQANLSKPLMQATVWWDSRLKVTSIF